MKTPTYDRSRLDSIRGVILQRLQNASPRPLPQGTLFVESWAVILPQPSAEEFLAALDELLVDGLVKSKPHPVNRDGRLIHLSATGDAVLDK